MRRRRNKITTIIMVQITRIKITNKIIHIIRRRTRGTRDNINNSKNTNNDK